MSFWTFCFLCLAFYYRREIGWNILYLVVLLVGTQEHMDRFMDKRSQYPDDRI